MLPFCRALEVALVMFVTLTASNIRAQSLNEDETSFDLPKGILSQRLLPEHLKTWQAIKNIIYSENNAGVALHPKLIHLFEKLDTSEHTIYVEFRDSGSRCRCTAGVFSIEKLDPEGTRHVAVIKLFLRDIEQAAARSEAKLKDGFAPLAGLNKLDRYTEVFAHEMAHAVDVLFNPERANMVDELIRKTDRLIYQRLHQKGGYIDPDIDRALRQRDAVLSELEKRAVSAEAIVWRELIESRRQDKDLKRINVRRVSTMPIKVIAKRTPND